MHVLKHSCFFDIFFDLENAKNMTKTIHEIHFHLVFFTNYLKLVNLIPDLYVLKELLPNF